MDFVLQSELKNVLSPHLALDMERQTCLSDWMRMAWDVAEIMRRAAQLHQGTPPGLLTDSEWFFLNTDRRTFNAVRETLARVMRSSTSAPFSRLGLEMHKAGLHIDDWAAKNALAIAVPVSYFVREYHIQHFGFPVVTNDAINLVGSYLGTSGPILEVGAGTGYMACEMQCRGMSVLPTDPMADDRSWMYSHYTDVQPLDGRQAVSVYPGLDMVYSWPEMDKYTAEILDGFTGRYLAYLGEGAGGCTGGADFHQRLQSGRFALLESVPLPRFRGIRDSLYIYENRLR